MRQARASEVIGKNVRNAQGENLGEVKDIIIDATNARVDYVVLAFGGFLGLGDKHFAYPLRAFRASSDKDELILNVDRERLKAAPGFDAKNYPDFNSGDYMTRVDRYFAPDFASTFVSSRRLVRSTELNGKDVNGRDGKDLGEIQDVVLNMATGDIRYVVLEFDQSWSLKDKLFAFPLKAFRAGAKWSDDLVLNVTKDQLNDTPSFDKKSWPTTNLNDPKYVRDIDRYLVTTTVVPLPSAANDAAFRKLDSNRDGRLSAEEGKADTEVQASWKKMDADSDGHVTRMEFDAIRK